jgi:hypothetical protein
MTSSSTLKPAYKNVIPAQTGTFETLEGNCHCGLVRVQFKISPPLKEYPVVSCNCSVCSRNGYLLIYPYREDITILQGEEALKTYTFARKRNQHKFCSNCGSSMFFDPDPPFEEWDFNGFNVSFVLIRLTAQAGLCIGAYA